MWCLWYQHCCYMILTAKAMAPVWLISEDNWNKVWHYANSVANGTISFLRCRQYKWGVTWLFVYLMPLALDSVSPHGKSIIHCTIAFLRLTIKMRCNIIFFFMSSYWHHYWNHMMPLPLVLMSYYTTALVSASYDVVPTFNDTIPLLRSRLFKQCATWLFCHLTPVELASFSNYANSIISGTMVFLRLRQCNEGAKLVMWCHLDATGVIIMWCRQHQKQHHCSPWVMLMEMRCNISFWSCDAISTG